MLETWDKNSSKRILQIPKVLITDNGDKWEEKCADGLGCSDSKGGSANAANVADDPKTKDDLEKLE